jgi:hypothetical protein
MEEVIYVSCYIQCISEFSERENIGEYEKKRRVRMGIGGPQVLDL